MRDKLDSLFKAYDIRGIYPNEIDEKLSFDIGYALSKYINDDTFIIGHDARLSSESLFKAFSSGIVSNGKKIKYIGLVPTDVVYTMSGLLNMPGVMVTASHNPKNWNGFKLCKAGAKPIGIESGLEEIRQLVSPSSNYQELPSFSKEDIFEDYLTHIKSIVNFKEINTNLKIGIDGGSGVAGAFIPEILENLGIEYSGIYLEPDGNFPYHPPDPSSKENLEDLIDLVLTNKLDFGVAFDGDADRAVFLDNKGNIITGSMMTAIISDWLYRKNKNLKVVHNVSVSPSVVNYLLNQGVTMIRSKVGHSYIKEIMHKEDADFGGEHSAHFYYKENYYADSAILTLLVFLEILSSKGNESSDLLLDYKFRPSSGEINFEVDDVIDSLNKIEGSFHGSFDKLDGLTYFADDYWFNIRGSNTEEKLRVNVEATNQAILSDVIQQIKNIIGV